MVHRWTSCRIRHEVHKQQNVAEHLPQSKRGWVRAAMCQVSSSGNVNQARSKLQKLASQLEYEHPGAAASLREGLEETLTLVRLGVGGALAKTLCSTNPIENLIGSVKNVARNVKRWRGGSMAVRWAVTGLIEATKRFRRIRGYRELPQLIAALDALVGLDKKEKIA